MATTTSPVPSWDYMSDGDGGTVWVGPGMGTTGMMSSGSMVPVTETGAPAPLAMLQGTPPPQQPQSPFPASTNPEQILERIRSMVAGQMVPTRQNAILGGILGNQRLANASPMALMQLLGPQIGQLTGQARQGQQQASRVLGPYGGGQARGAQTDITSSLMGNLARLFSGGVTKGQQGLMDIAQGTSTMLPMGQRSGTSTSVSDDFNPMAMAYGMMGLGNLGAMGIQGLQSAMMPSQMDMMAGMGGGMF